MKLVGTVITEVHIFEADDISVTEVYTALEAKK